MEVLIINGVDYSTHIAAKGVGWSRNDIDSEKTTRTKDARMRRDKIATKRKLNYKLINMTREQLAELDDALSKPEYTATYLDLHGKQQRTFYTSTFSANLESLYDEDGQWGGAAFDMIEV